MKPIYSFDDYFSADTPFRGSAKIETIKRWTEIEDADYEKGFLRHYKPKKFSLAEKWDNFLERFL